MRASPWRWGGPSPFSSGTDAIFHQPIHNLFTGINVDVSVRDNDAFILKVGYNITLLGKIVFLEHVIT